MNSATSTDPQSLQPWQFFTLAGLVGATIVVFLSEGQSPVSIILLSLIIFGAAGVGIAAWRMFSPLAGASEPVGPQIFGGRTRAALEREKTLVLRSIKDLSSITRWARYRTRTFRRWARAFALGQAG
jgi:hypothetical protein